MSFSWGIRAGSVEKSVNILRAHDSPDGTGITRRVFEVIHVALLVQGSEARGVGPALRLFEIVRDSSDHPVLIGEVGRACGQSGDREEALLILDELVELGEQRYVPPRAFASVYRGLDSLDMAMDYLIRAAEVRDPSLQWDIRMLDQELQAHPRYPELMRLMRLEP